MLWMAVDKAMGSRRWRHRLPAGKRQDRTSGKVCCTVSKSGQKLTHIALLLVQPEDVFHGQSVFRSNNFRKFSYTKRSASEAGLADCCTSPQWRVQNRCFRPSRPLFR